MKGRQGMFSVIDVCRKTTNPIIGDIPWNSPKDILWLSSDNHYEFDGSDDYYNGDIYGVDKNGRIIWMEYKFNYFAHFGTVLKFLSENPGVVEHAVDDLYDKPGYYKTLDISRDVFVDAMTFHGDADEFIEKISSIVKNETSKSCR